MTMFAGNVIVMISSDGSSATVTGADDNSAAATLYTALVAADQSSPDTVSTPVITPPQISMDPVTGIISVVTGSATTVQTPVNGMKDASGNALSDPTSSPPALQAKAKLANTLGSWVVNYIQTNATVLFVSGSGPENTGNAVLSGGHYLVSGSSGTAIGSVT